MANGRGGRREGAGRPRTSLRYAQPAEKALDKIAARLDDLLEVQFRVAMGGYELVEREYTREKGDGENAGELSLSKRKIKVAEPNMAALESLVTRIIGRPVHQLELSTVEGEKEEMSPELVARIRQTCADFARERLEARDGEAV